MRFLKDEFHFGFPQEEIRALLNLDNPGKPHIGNLMVKYGYAKTKEEAIRNYIDKKRFQNKFVRPEEANLVGGKDPKTDWILRVNSISNKLSKESYSVPVDEYSYVKSIYDWLMGILVF